MKFDVRISPGVLEAIDTQIGYLQSQGAPQDRIERWFADLLAAVDDLAEMPGRWPVAEAISAAAGYDVRRLLRGDYVLFFRIDESQSVVYVIAFRHGRQSPPTEFRVP